MKRLKIKDILTNNESGFETLVKGWVKTKRGSKNVNFIALNDGSTIHNLQIVAETANFDESLLSKITTGAAISVSGTLSESQGSGQKVELLAKSIELLGSSRSGKISYSTQKTFT